MSKLKLMSMFTLSVFFGIMLFGCMRSETSKNKTCPKVKIVTEIGDVLIDIDVINAPVTAANFMKYVDEKRFTNTSFYRVVRMDNQPDNTIKIEVIQGGLGFEESSLRLPPVIHENTDATSIVHRDGIISMARNEPGSASSEFFICVGDQPELNFGGSRNPDGQGFAAFGRVVNGMEVVRRIQAGIAEGQMLISPILIKKIERVADNAE